MSDARLPVVRVTGAAGVVVGELCPEVEGGGLVLAVDAAKVDPVRLWPPPTLGVPLWITLLVVFPLLLVLRLVVVVLLLLVLLPKVLLLEDIVVEEFVLDPEQVIWESEAVKSPSCIQYFCPVALAGVWM